MVAGSIHGPVQSELRSTCSQHDCTVRAYVMMRWHATSSSRCPSTTMFVLAECICFTTDFRSAGHDKFRMSPQISNRHLSSFARDVSTRLARGVINMNCLSLAQHVKEK